MLTGAKLGVEGQLSSVQVLIVKYNRTEYNQSEMCHH